MVNSRLRVPDVRGSSSVIDVSIKSKTGKSITVVLTAVKGIISRQGVEVEDLDEVDARRMFPAETITTTGRWLHNDYVRFQIAIVGCSTGCFHKLLHHFGCCHLVPV